MGILVSISLAIALAFNNATPVESETGAPLTKTARKLIATRDWDFWYYVWLTDHSLIFFQVVDRDTAGSKNNLIIHERNKPVILSLPTGRRTSLASTLGLQNDDLDGMSWVAASPGGKWYLWIRLPIFDPAERPSLASADGAQSQQNWGTGLPNRVGHWSPDGSWWASISVNTGTQKRPFFCSVSRPFPERATVLRPPLDLLDLFPDAVADAEGKEPGPFPYVGITVQGQALMTYTHRKDENMADLAMFTIGEIPAAKRGRVTFEKGEQIRKILLAPNGDRIAWLTAKQGRDGREFVRLYFSDLEGQNCVLLGWLPMPAWPDDHQPDPNSLQMHWTPDSKQLSFIVDDWLYTIPASTAQSTKPK